MKRVEINKLKELLFAKDEVLVDVKKVLSRKFHLKRALLLGNLYKRKVTLKFKTIEGSLRRVEATVWAVGDKFVSLKAGITIPIKSIVSVEY
ncbi:MAG: hypothetical protein GY810_02725 [Aureispira sp.]|nr:hypothetical protein [Aureispira sp.]